MLLQQGLPGRFVRAQESLTTVGRSATSGQIDGKDLLDEAGEHGVLAQFR